TFYRWKRKFGDLGVSELRELRQVRDENRRLKRVVADLTLDKQILQESLRNKFCPRRSGGAGSRGCGRPFGSRRAARAGRPGCGARCSRTRVPGRPGAYVSYPLILKAVSSPAGSSAASRGAVQGCSPTCDVRHLTMSTNNIGLIARDTLTISLGPLTHTQFDPVGGDGSTILRRHHRWGPPALASRPSRWRPSSKIVQGWIVAISSSPNGAQGSASKRPRTSASSVAMATSRTVSPAAS